MLAGIVMVAVVNVSSTAIVSLEAGVGAPLDETAEHPAKVTASKANVAIEGEEAISPFPRYH